MPGYVLPKNWDGRGPTRGGSPSVVWSGVGVSPHKMKMGKWNSQPKFSGDVGLLGCLFRYRHAVSPPRAKAFQQKRASGMPRVARYSRGRGEAS